MHIAILHNAVGETAALEDQDVLVQVEAVTAALVELGHTVAAVPVSLDLARLRKWLEDHKPALVFNLVEGLEDWDSLSSFAPALLDALGLPYTGNATEATFLTTHKVLAKERMQQAGLPTPAWLSSGNTPIGTGHGGPDKWIIKGIWEQASRNLDEDAIVGGDAAAVARQLADRAARFGRPCYAEQFIAGREFNVALLTSRGRPVVLPPAEIDFSAFPPEKPRIVGYRAKWLADSFEYNNTPRRFEFPESDKPLLERLRALALHCWDVFGLRGYVRVDFRVDAAGQPWILEVNTNPCLSPDAGYAAALKQADISFTAAIGRIVAECARLTDH